MLISKMVEAKELTVDREHTDEIESFLDGSNWEFSKADPTANIVGFLYRKDGNGPWRHMVSHGQVLTRVADIVVFGRA